MESRLFAALRSALPAMFLVLALPLPGAAQQLRPVLNCVTFHPDTNVVDAYFGYVSFHPTVVMHEVGDFNFFSPDPQDRGQLTFFHPGVHHRAFFTSFQVSPSIQQLNWFLDFTPSASATPFAPACDQAQQVRPLLNCVTYHAGTDVLDAYFGFASSFPAAVTRAVGDFNFFAPDHGIADSRRCSNRAFTIGCSWCRRPCPSGVSRGTSVPSDRRRRVHLRWPAIHRSGGGPGR